MTEIHASEMTATDDSKTIDVYVRLCNGDEEAPCRELSFRIPEEIEQKELLDRGYAIDGHSAIGAVTESPQDTLADALLNEQRELIGWLDKHGYSVTFR